VAPSELSHLDNSEPVSSGLQGALSSGLQGTLSCANGTLSSGLQGSKRFWGACGRKHSKCLLQACHVPPMTASTTEITEITMIIIIVVDKFEDSQADADQSSAPGRKPGQISPKDTTCTTTSLSSDPSSFAIPEETDFSIPRLAFQTFSFIDGAGSTSSCNAVLIVQVSRSEDAGPGEGGCG